MERFSTTPDLIFELHFDGQSDGDHYRMRSGTVAGWQWINGHLIDRNVYRYRGCDGGYPVVLIEQRDAYKRAMQPATAAGLRVRVEC